MSILGRDGNISAIRVATIAAIVGIVIILAGIALFFVDRASHQRPYDIDPYPGSTLWYQTDRATNARQVVYRVQAASVDDVAAYYQKKLAELVGSNSTEKCLRFPKFGNDAEFDKGDKSIPPYRFSCMFDLSGFQISQSTRVNIQPGVESNNSAGMVLIEYEQLWQR